MNTWQASNVNKNWRVEEPWIVGLFYFYFFLELMCGMAFIISKCIQWMLIAFQGVGRRKSVNIWWLIRAWSLAGSRKLQTHLHCGCLASRTHPITEADSVTNIDDLFKNWVLKSRSTANLSDRFTVLSQSQIS